MDTVETLPAPGSSVPGVDIGPDCGTPGKTGQGGRSDEGQGQAVKEKCSDYLMLLKKRKSASQRRPRSTQSKSVRTARFFT